MSIFDEQDLSPFPIFRNWRKVKTFVVATIFPVAMGLAITYFVFWGMRSSSFYTQAVEMAQNDPQVMSALGNPVEPGWWVAGSISTQGLSGEANLSIPLSGPRGKGTLYADGRRITGVWQYYSLAVVVKSSGEIIDLLR
ncbi:MAG: cytochrome c oxidase assembly factor 1 family protein [Anaerolineae bacterium]|nr:cytochrome c oxidase assembly factor 1 family protein [Anaerolineae bacterium]